uniref:Piwi domain-containing protein n=1 Tax=Anisakis simplex TaxID=6269 RepID=A0A0M3K3Z5_ANISI
LLPRADRREWSHDIGAGIEAWTGVYSAVKVCRKGLMLNADVSTKVFYKLDMPVMDYYLSIINDVKRGQVMNRRNIAMDERQRLSLKFTYSDIYMKYVGIGKPANVQRFTMNGQNGEAFELTVEEYFRRYKDIELRYPDLPVIQCGSSSRHIYIPMELVNLSDKVQRVTKMLNEFQLPKLIRVCGIDPKERFKQIDYMLNGLDQSRMDNFLHSFDVELDNRFVELNGRVLPSPHLELHNGFRIAVRDGVWPLENQVKEAPVRVIFGVICVDRAIEYQQFRPCFKTFMSACELFGMQFADGFETVEGVPLYEWDSSAIRSNPLLPKVIEFKTSLFEHERSHHVKIKPMLIFIVPRENPLVYGHVKVVCDLKEGIASQVLLSKTLTKMSGNPERCAVAHNVFLKVNAKLDGVNNGVCRESLEWSKFTNKNEATLFIGVDVTHPAPTDKQSPSIAAVVSSIDVTATRYSCSFKLQHCRNDRIIQMVDPLKERLIDFYRKSGLTPAHIVIFRDGVSNSEFLGTMNEELTNLKVAMNQLEPSYNPTVSYVVIQKRHHTRFYVEGKQYARCKSNVPPGTVVDDDITSPNIFDFYLCSHLGAIGTSRPAHYTVLYDSWNLSADQWQQMAYALCHLYTRCARSVSIPAPIYYAHLACKRARFYVNETLLVIPYSISGYFEIDFKDIEVLFIDMFVSFFRGSSKPGSSLESKEGERIATELNEKIRVHDNTPRMYYV